MTQGDKIRNAIRGLGITMEEASVRLGISRPTLFSKLNAAEIDEKFLQNVNDKLGISIAAIDKGATITTVASKVIDEIEMRYNVIPLKKNRVAELWIPKDFNKEDLPAIKKWIELKESTL